MNKTTHKTMNKPLINLINLDDLYISHQEVTNHHKCPKAPIKKVSHWYYVAWVQFDRHIPRIFSYRYFESWLYAVRKSMQSLNNLRDLEEFEIALEKELVNHADKYSEAIKDSLRREIGQKRIQIERENGPLHLAESVRDAYLQIIETSEDEKAIELVMQLIKTQYPILIQFPDILKSLLDTCHQRREYLKHKQVVA